MTYGGTGRYQAGNCQLQDGADASGCDGSHYNLDLYTMETPPTAGGGHRRSLEALTAEVDRRMLQLAGLGRFDTEECGFGDLAARAQMVDVKCCSGATGDGAACQDFLPATCSYTCASQFVAFFDGARQPHSLTTAALV